jgi:outer membrane murein-binding lipoprotein Lpp
MLHELFYTSAANTFDGPGYGVVGRTHGFPPLLEKFVRQISHYDFLPASGENAESANPPAFSHLIWNDSGQRWHVLSRIGFGGYDYSRRAVFLAHHVAVADDDSLAGNPARLMQEPSLFSSSWNGDPRELAPRDFRRHLARTATAAAWEGLTGDRNWSAAWLEKCRTHARESCFLVVPADVDVLALFSESLASLPDAQAWHVTFSTYLGTGRAPAQIDWGALIDGTPASRQFRTRYPDRVLQVTENLGMAPVAVAPDARRPTGPFQEAAAPHDEFVAFRSPESRDDAAGDFQSSWLASQARGEYAVQPVAGSQSGSRSARKAPAPSPLALPLPPPPPPQSPGILSQPYLIWAVVFLVAVVGIGMWGNAQAKLTKAERELEKATAELDRVNLKLEQVDESRIAAGSDLAAAKNELENTKQSLAKAKEDLAKTNKEKADKNPAGEKEQQKKEQLVEASARAPVASVVRIQHGLRLAIKAKDGRLLDHDFPRSPKLLLTPHPDPDFTLQQHVEEHEEITVSHPNFGHWKLRLRLADQAGQKSGLFASWEAGSIESGSDDSGSKDEILDRLYLSYLDVVGDAADGEGKTSRVRVLFNPRLKPLKFETAELIKSPADDDTLHVLKTLARQAKSRIRVDRITLHGQPLDLRLTRKLEGDFAERIAEDIFQGKSQWVNVELATRLPASSGLPVVKVEVRDHPNGTDNDTKNRPGADPGCKVLAELLRRIGEVHGSVLITYRNGPVVPILQFGNPLDQ